MHGRKSDKMFHAHVVKLEITKDKGKANELLQAEWVLLRVLETIHNVIGQSGWGPLGCHLLIRNTGTSKHYGATKEC